VQGQALRADGIQGYLGAVRISELALAVRVPTSTVRYYERIGLLREPERTAAGYRDYDSDAANRLLFVHRARTIGLSCEQIAELLPVWDGANCTGARVRITDLIEQKQVEIAERIVELEALAVQLDAVQSLIDSAPAPATCATDLSCCMPAGPVDVTLNAVSPTVAPRHKS
jgi:DNA-binding transcriptional MerR regulator